MTNNQHNVSNNSRPINSNNQGRNVSKGTQRNNHPRQHRNSQQLNTTYRPNNDYNRNHKPRPDSNLNQQQNNYNQQRYSQNGNKPRHSNQYDMNYSTQAAGYQSYEQFEDDFLFVEDDEFEEEEKKKSKKWTCFYWFLVIALVAITAGCGWYIWHTINKSTLPDEVKQSIVEDVDGKKYLTIDWDALSELYPNLRGWIYIPNTGVNYPIVQNPADDDEYYLTHGPANEPNDQGAIFMTANADPDFQDDNTMLYGHSVQYYGGMFSGLNKFMEEEHFEENPYIYILTPTNTYRADIRLIANTEEGTPYYITGYGDWSNASENLSWQLLNAAHIRSLDVKKGDHMITLSTCDLREGLYTEKRYVLQGVLEYYMGKVEILDSDLDDFYQRFGTALKEQLGITDTGNPDDIKDTTKDILNDESVEDDESEDETEEISSD